MLGLVAVSLGLGVAIAPWLHAHPLTLLALPLPALLRHRPRLAGAALALMLILAAAWWATWRTPIEGPEDVASLAPRRFLRLEGVVATPPMPKGDEWRAEVVITGATGGRVMATWPSEARPSVGDSWRFAGRLRRPSPPGNPGEFDYGKFLARSGIYATYHAEEAVALGPAPGWVGPRVLDRLRMRLLEGLGAGLAPGDAALLGSLVVGAGAAPVPEATETAFRRVGLAHMLAASGAQVALLTAILYAGFLRAFRSPGRAALLTAPWLLLYLGLTGAPPSMVRATLMGLVALGGMALDRRNVPYASLHLTAAVMLIAEPAVVHDLGWQFSLLATYGLLRLSGWMRDMKLPGPDWLWGLVLVPVAASAWVSPWQAAIFQTWSWWSLPANWLASPFLVAITPWGMAVAVVGLVWPAAAAWLNVLSGWMLWGLQAMVFALAALPGSEIGVVAPIALGLLTVYAALWCGFRRKREAIALTLLALVLWTPPVPPGELRLVFLSVGQGDGIALRTPGGRWVVVDAGPAGDGFDAGASQVVPYLRREGCDRVSLMIGSHAHQDHVGGLAAVSAAFPVDRGWDAGQAEAAPGERAVLASWLARGVPWDVPAPGLTWEADGVRLTVLSARREAHSTNDGSIVVMVHYGRFRALLTGDLEAEGERTLLAEGADLRCDLLKLGHHGSRSSTTPLWLAAARPSLAVISAGLDNRFGHPHRVVTTRLARAGVPAMRTDHHGAVVVRTDGRAWHAESVRGPRLRGRAGGG